MLSRTYTVLLIAILAIVLSWFVFRKEIELQPILAETLTEDVKIAIIGSGIGGSSASYFIRKHLGPKAEIHVYEEADEVGGRLAVAKIGGHVIETGGTLIHSSNKYMGTFIKELGLEQLQQTDHTSKFGIFNGKEFVFIQGVYSFITKLKMLWRYGFFSLLYLDISLSNMLEQFQNIYKIQDEGHAFLSVQEMLDAMGGLFNYTQKTAEEVMHENGISKLLIEELVTAVTRSNYGQDSHVNAFTGYVSMAGAQGGSLFSVKGGNYQVPKKLLEASNATIFLKHHISSIRKEMYNGKIVYFLDEKGDSKKDYNIHKEKVDGDVVLTFSEKHEKAYDVVIVAVPMEVGNSYVKCSECRDWPNESLLGNFQQTVATFVQGDINYKHFDLEKEEALTAIFTTESVNIPFSSIGSQINVTGGSPEPPIYKVFSRKKLKDVTLKELFQIYSTRDNYIKSWLAYPHYTPPEMFSPFVLDDGVFYVNAIERAASAMEMSAVGGRNVALLTKDYFVQTNRIFL